MTVTQNEQYEVFSNGERIIFPRDGEHSSSAFLTGFDVNDNVTFGRLTTDGRLKVDASVTIDTVDIGTVILSANDTSSIQRWLNPVLNPDGSTYALYVQDQRMNFLGSDLEVSDAGTQSRLDTLNLSSSTMLAAVPSRILYIGGRDDAGQLNPLQVDMYRGEGHAHVLAGSHIGYDNSNGRVFSVSYTGTIGTTTTNLFVFVNPANSGKYAYFNQALFDVLSRGDACDWQFFVCTNYTGGTLGTPTCRLVGSSYTSVMQGYANPTTATAGDNLGGYFIGENNNSGVLLFHDNLTVMPGGAIVVQATASIANTRIRMLGIWTEDVA